MRKATLMICCLLAIGGCSRIGQVAGAVNPLRIFNTNAQAPTTLEPREGWTNRQDARQPLANIAGASWKPLNDGRLLVVQVNTPTKGWWDMALITATPQPAGRLRPDEDGVLRLLAVGNPPLSGSPDATRAADPRIDGATLALPISQVELNRIKAVEIGGATNSIRISR